MKRIYEKVKPSEGCLGTIIENSYDIKGARQVAWCFKRVMPHSKIHVRRGHIVVAACKNQVDFWSGLQFAERVSERIRKRKQQEQQ